MTPVVVDHHRRQQQQGEQTMQSAYLPSSARAANARHPQQHEGGAAAIDRPPAPPLVAPNDPSLLMKVVSAVPKFPPPEMTDADRTSTLVYSPAHQKTAVVKNVLIPRPHCLTQGHNGVLSGPGNRHFSSSTDEMDIDTSGNSKEETSAESQQHQTPQRAYWLQRTLRSAIYGKVRYGVVLRRRPRGAASSDAEWEVTEEACAVKEMVWDKIRRYHGRHAEDPMNEVGALQYLMEFKREQQKQAKDDHLLVPLDILSDEANLYIVSPYCSGGELFDILDETDKFSEREARYWMKQILLGLYHLQRAGICHRDLSLENLLVHDRKTLVIDLGMCLRIPYEGDDKYDPPDRDGNVGINMRGGAHDHAQDAQDESRGPTPSPPRSNSSRSPPRMGGGRHNRRRLLLPPQGLCGKWHYMSPEILADRDPFDGFAVDLWAAGVILFLMVTGFPPWERADDSDERFRYLTQGYMKQLLTQWELGLSGDLMDLLQKLLYKDPMMRLTLREVMEHPWLQPSSGRGTRRNSPRSPAA